MLIESIKTVRNLFLDPFDDCHDFRIFERVRIVLAEQSKNPCIQQIQVGDRIRPSIEATYQPRMIFRTLASLLIIGP